MKKVHTILFAILYTTVLFAQQAKEDSTSTKLGEIIVIGNKKASQKNQHKSLITIDDYLEKSSRVTMIKRGSYAWEPTINNMSTERISLTIDGMQIYGACTDKMDPTTSYVAVSNLKEVSIHSGQEGTENGNSIGGAIDLKLPTAHYTNTGLKSVIDLGYETNGNYTTTGLDVTYSGKKHYITIDGIFRDTDNYNAGNNKEVLYSQFRKYNFSLQSGHQLSKKHAINTTIIHDRATNIGYPSLPMDVSLATATIASLAHHYNATDKNAFIQHWETKVYANTITHIMDDSKRPDVPIRMDMPGYSDTYGLYSKLHKTLKKHQLTANITAHYNRSLAEMTMYPNNPDENDMFMYTWPDIRTTYVGLYLKDVIALNKKQKIQFSARLGSQKNAIKNTVGLESLQIFYPNLSPEKNTLLGSFSSNYTYKNNNLKHSFGIGYGQRASSVSEAYGFYLFNSFDGYDYIGNPKLKKEQSLEFNLSSSYKKEQFNLSFEASYFKIYNYAIGKINPDLSAMTIGANGVKTYIALPYANMYNVSIQTQYSFLKAIHAKATFGYAHGTGDTYGNLPLISPFFYSADITYHTPKIHASVQITGNQKKGSYSINFGEKEIPSYAIINLHLGNTFRVKNNKTILRYGVENVLDTNYTTYADWNNLKRKGRNFYINLTYMLQ